MALEKLYALRVFSPVIQSTCLCLSHHTLCFPLPIPCIVSTTDLCCHLLSGRPNYNCHDKHPLIHSRLIQFTDHTRSPRLSFPHWQEIVSRGFILASDDTSTNPVLCSEGFPNFAQTGRFRYIIWMYFLYSISICVFHFCILYCFYVFCVVQMHYGAC